MRRKTFGWTVLFLAILTPMSFAQKTKISFYGLCLGPHLTGDPTRGDKISQKTAAKLIAKIAPYCSFIRIYSTGNGCQYLAIEAKKRGLKVAAGAWLSKDLDANQREISSLINLVKKNKVDLAVVGGEVLLRHDLTEEQLIGYLSQVKRATRATVTTNEVYDTLIKHPRLVAACDLVLANFYPYWEGVEIEKALDCLDNNYHALKKVAGSKEVVIGETGWPSAGNTIGDAEANAENAAIYLQSSLKWASKNQIKCFYFAAFDEPWKEKFEGLQGAHWGIWDKSAVIKPWAKKVLAGQTPSIKSKSPTVNLPGTPSVLFTFVPKKGSMADLKGKVTGVNPDDYRIAVYIYVGGGWWTKPYWDHPTVRINRRGQFVCDITTGGVDERATAIVAFLVKKNHSPPLASGGALPSLEYLAKKNITR